MEYLQLKKILLIFDMNFMRQLINKRNLRLSSFILGIVVIQFEGCLQTHAQSVALGAPFRINTFTQSVTESASTAIDGDGNFVVVWQSSVQDGDNAGIFAQCYDLQGARKGLEFQVNSYTQDFQGTPDIAMDHGGDFVICWESSGQDGSGLGIYAQRYNSDGSVQGAEFKVNTITSQNQVLPKIAMSYNGDFVIIWNSADIKAQRYNALGVPIGSEFKVNTSNGDRRDCVVAMDSTGNFIVSWSSYDQDGDRYGVYAQLYDSFGNKVGTEFRVNTSTTLDQRYSSVAMNNDGDFVIAWESNIIQPAEGTFYERFDVYAQRYNKEGIPQGQEIFVNTYTNLSQESPSVAMNKSGGFIITWQSLAQDGSTFSIYAQCYAANGLRVGDEFAVEHNYSGCQDQAKIVMNEKGDLVVIWREYASPYGIFGQRFQYSLSPITAIGNLENNIPINIYPNPATSKIYNNDKAQVNISLLNLAGNILKDGVFVNNYFDVSDIPKGMYIVILSRGGARECHKLLIQ